MGLELFAVPLAGSLIFVCVMERVVHAVLCLTFGDKNSNDPMKQMTAQQLVMRQVDLVSSLIVFITQSLTRLFGALLRWWFTIVFIFGLFVCVYVIYEEYSDTVVELVSYYNADIGPWVANTVIVPLQILDLILRSLLPLWNGVVWFSKAIFFKGLYPILIQEITTVFRMATVLVEFCLHFVDALTTFIESFDCTGLECLIPENRVFNALTVMGDVREFVSLGVLLCKQICGSLAAPLDILFFPFLDINFGKAIHNYINSVFYFTLVMPQMTYERCTLFSGSDSFSLMMCTPDLAPVFDYAVAGTGNLGYLIDNWANVVLVIVQQFLTGSAPECASENTAFIPNVISGEFFGNSTTVTVGLTDWLYAVTDGISSVYMGSSGSRSIRYQTWPYAMDISLGIAAVSYSTSSDIDISAISGTTSTKSFQSTALMGCNCSDTSTGMKILCAILPMSGIPSSGFRQDYLLGVLFPDEHTSGYLVCEGVDIYVKSVRWPFNRYESNPVQFGTTQTALPSNDCISRGNCKEVDSSVWVVPRCNYAGNNFKACLPSATCFPFCMAVRAAGSTNNNLVLSSGDRWRNGLTILQRDCAVSVSSPSRVGSNMPGSGTVSRVQSQSNAFTSRNVFASSDLNSQECRPASGISSIVDKPTSSVSIRLSVQPFVITGDCVFTESELGGGTSTVQVERLLGNEQNVFSLSALNQDIPAEPRLDVPESEFVYSGRSKVLIPYYTQYSRMVAVSSRTHVFYASNPALEVFSVYFEYCSLSRDQSAIPRFGFLMSSSYSPIRIYRVNAYSRDAHGTDLVRFVNMEGFVEDFSKKCNQVFNSSITDMEYLNEDNIALSVSVNGVSDYESGVFVGGTTVTYWLNPSTMQISDKIFQTQVPASNLGVLCPGMQRLPRLGTFFAEVINAGIFFVRYIFWAFLYTPGMADIWKAGGQCPAVPGGTKYHSILNNCGDDILMLDDFFDSLQDASGVFWQSLSVIGDFAVSDSDSTGARTVKDILDGMAKYGEGSIDIWTSSSSIMTLTSTPLMDGAQNVFKMASGGTNIVQGGFHVNVGAVAWCRFSYKATAEVALVLTKSVLNKQGMTQDAIWQAIWSTLYELKDYYRESITEKTRMACAGMKLMMGNDNPWANLVYYPCVANLELSDAVLNVMLDIFVDIPMAKCVCKDSAGYELTSFVTEVCAKNTPPSLRPTLYMIVNQIRGSLSSDYQSLACESVLTITNERLSKGLDEWFSNMYLGLDALASSVDYALASFDHGAGHCLDFQNDPHVVVIVPQPVDYFQKCASTTLCKRKCSAEWDQFQAYAIKQQDTTSIDLTVSVESLFFPGSMDSSLSIGNVTAATEILSSGICVRSADYALALAQLGNSGLGVQFWCVPQMPGVSVYQSSQSGLATTLLPGALMQSTFGDGTGTWLALMLRLGADNRAFVMNSSGVFELPDVPLETGHYLVRILNVWAIEGTVVVDVVTRYFRGDPDPASLADMSHFYFLDGIWRQTSVDLTQFADDYWYTRFPDRSYIFFAKTAGLPCYTVAFSVDSETMIMTALFPMSDMSTTSYLGSVTGGYISCFSLSMNNVFVVAGNSWDWLQQIRLFGTGISGVFNSVPVTTSIQVKGNCNAQSCEGCSDLVTQRLCLAFNKCSLMRCVGTPVNQKRPLCGIGQLISFDGQMSLQTLNGAWTIFTEMLGIFLKLSLTSTSGVDVAWPEDAFMGYVCTAKDRNAELFSVMTSTINSVMQGQQANVGYLYGGAGNVDTNADAMLTTSSTSLNAFLYQLSLAPLYAMIASHQIMMCQVKGVLAVVGQSGFVIRLESAELGRASDLISGQCLTIGTEVLAQYPSQNAQSLGYTLTNMVTNTLHLYLIQTIEPSLHYLDAGLTYMIGVIHTMGGLIMSYNLAKCNPPDFSLQDIVNCSCGDVPLSIPSTVDSKHWCTGTLTMVDSNNNQFVVYNPYAYSRLQTLSIKMKEYIICASSSYQGCIPPSDPVFEDQGVSVLNVLVKCRENFVQKQWDAAAYVLYNSSLHYLFRYRTLVPEPPEDPCGIKTCLLESARDAQPPESCVTQYLECTSLGYEEYWSYFRSTHVLSPEYTDSCMVFTGPASQNFSEFADCVDGTGNAKCSLGAHVWSPGSDNKIPVAEAHMVQYRGQSYDGLVRTLYRQANDLVLKAVTESMQSWIGETPAVDVQFFSTEGDVIHQILDCIFLGPYAQMNYWPIPYCEPGEECLAGPNWTRSDGLDRNVNPNTCQSSSSLPYTCGSQSRRAMISYFVKEVVSKGNSNSNVTLIQTLVLGQLNSIMSAWNSTDRYGCTCPDGKNAPVCCKNSGVTMLPSNLDLEYVYLNGDSALDAIDTEFTHFYNLAMQNVDPWLKYLPDSERLAYDWSQSHRAKEEGRTDPVDPVYNHSTQENVSPLESGQRSMWDICHGALKQVFFTMPVSLDGAILFEFDAVEFDGDPAALESYIKALTRRAFLDSPLYRHYHPKHIPSWSLMCDQPPGSHPASQPGKVKYDDYVQQGTLLFRGNSLSEFPVFNHTDFAIGAASCMCGWQYDALTDSCLVPDENIDTVCMLVACTAGRFHRTSQGILLDAFDPLWMCPDVEMSPHWGFLDEPAQELWLQGQTNLQQSTSELLSRGRAGLRIGNVDTLRQVSKRYVNPVNREIPLERARIPKCGYDANGVNDFIHALFPMAQGVEDSGVTAYCIRYVIETARLEVLAMTKEYSGESAYAAQRQTVSTWRKRCGAQLQLLSLCVNLNVFVAPIEKTVFSKSCRHFLPILYDNAYSTGECLVNIGGVFYDPCRCVPCTGTSWIALELNSIKRPECLLKFDPRTALAQGPMGLWSVVEDPSLNVFTKDSANFLNKGFLDILLNDPDAGPNTHTNGDYWYQTEGYMSDNSEDCSNIVDYWKDDWEFPVGYHATVPCHHSDTAYRSFSKAFGLDFDSITNEPIMRYEHDLLRDSTRADISFGEMGLCRTGNFGMDMYEANTMRYCTQVPLDQTEDYAVPFQVPSFITDWTDPVCSRSSRDLPWPDHTVNQLGYDSSVYSIGTVPNFPDSASTTYPASLDNLWDVGPQHDPTWGGQCSDFAFRTCSVDLDCPVQFACQSSVCVSIEVDCMKHSDCSGGMMCTGLGTCVTPTISFQNRLLDQDVAFQVYANGTCGDQMRNFSMSGGSYWGYVSEDLMRVHGMCSYGDWYRYQQTLQKCASVQDSDTYTVDPTQCFFNDLQSTIQNQTYWWNPGANKPNILSMRPTDCDRDYERLEGFQSCAPVKAKILLKQIERMDLSYDRFFRLYSQVQSSQFKLAKMPYATNKRYGFLGIGNFSSDNDMTDIFKSCAQIDQCYPSPFRVNNVPTVRTMKSGNSRVAYPVATVFKCGAIGIDTGSACKLDLDVLPLYRYLCNFDTKLPSCVPLVQGLDDLCNQITFTYQPSYVNILKNVQGLVKLFYAFPTPVDLEGYLDMTTCMTNMYAGIQQTGLSKGLYFPFVFTLFEFPFDWYYQCLVMADTAIDDKSRLSQNCAAFNGKTVYTINGYSLVRPSSDDFMTYLKFVRGGYLRSYYDNYDTVNTGLVDNALTQCIQQFRDTNYGGSDLSYPRCSDNLVWLLGDYGSEYNTQNPYDINYRSLIYNYYTTEKCKGSWLADLLTIIQDKTGVFLDNWEDVMSIPDPYNLSPQKRGGDTVLNAIKNFAMSKMVVTTFSVSNAQVVGCITFNTVLPPEYDFVGAPVDSSLVPLDPFMQAETINSATDSTVNMTCIFNQLDDPHIETYSSNQCRSQVETSKTQVTKKVVCRDGTKEATCVLVPTIRKRKGAFNCRYSPDIPTGSLCNSSNPGCVTSVIKSIYSSILGCYKAPVVNPLPTQELPWFSASNTWDFDFNFREALDYQNNIQPDTSKTVMCSINTDEQNRIDFMKCQNPHYSTLKKHAYANYVYNGSVDVPASGQLEWEVDRFFFGRGAIYAFANTNRQLNHTFFDALFDDDTVCKGEINANQRICYKRQSDANFQSLNPWTLGYWNPFSECDIGYMDQNQGSKEFIDTYCSANACPATFPSIPDMPFGVSCSGKYRQLVSIPGVPGTDSNGDYLRYNLCQHKLVEDSDGCMHNQGLLGGYDGLPVAAPQESLNMLVGTKWSTQGYRVAQNMYEGGGWDIPDDFTSGIFGFTNPLWKGETAPYGFLKIPDWEIGIHRIGMMVNMSESGDIISNLLVVKLPLTDLDNGVLLDSAAFRSLDVGMWVPSLQYVIQTEHAHNLAQTTASFVNTVSAACPLRRFMHYSGRNARFSPVIPSPSRAKRLFGRITGNMLAHPVMTPTDDGRHLGKYKTTNGFCFCPLVPGVDQKHCLVPIDSTGAACGLKETIQALAGNNLNPLTSNVFPVLTFRQARRPCTMQLDWPFVNNTLRDGSNHTGNWDGASNPIDKQCHVLDRFRPFKYYYKSERVMLKSGLNTVRDGVCKTSRVTSLNKPTSFPPGRCLKYDEQNDYAQFVCEKTTSRPKLTRRVPLTPPQTIARSRTMRRKCNMCSSPPRFETSNNHPIPPESSFGIPFRASVERVLSKDIRDAICNVSLGNCPAFNEEAWGQGRFMRNYLQSPTNLFSQGFTGYTAGATPGTTGLDDSSLWENPWVYCPDVKSLSTSEGCQGHIKRDQWIQDKTNICPHMVKSISSKYAESSGKDPMAVLSFCNIHSSTDLVCKAVTEAKLIIQRANCIARGDVDCLPTPFVYHPATYEITNQAWVHDTVSRFYRSINPNSCPLSQSELGMAAYNQRYQLTCPANSVFLFEQILVIVRLVATQVCLLISTLLSMTMNILAMIFPGNRQTYKQNLLNQWAWVKKETTSFMYTLSDMFFDMLLNSGNLGNTLMTFIGNSCGLLNKAFDWFVGVWCDFAKVQMLQLIGGIRRVVTMVQAGFEVLNDFMDYILAGVLPASFVAKYGTGIFQNMLLEKYAEPTDKKKGGVNSKVSSSVNTKAASKAASFKNGLNKAAGFATSGPGKAAIGILVGVTLFNLIDEERLRNLYPANWTMFDFKDAIAKLDDVEFVLQEEQTCFVYQILRKMNSSYQIVSCSKFSLDSYRDTTQGQTSLDATICWADARPSLGQSTLFSCSSGSTCCSTTTCQDFVPCHACPIPSFEGINQYGCDGLRQKCVCGMDQGTHTQCSANSQCGSLSQCVLVSSLNGVSYGTIPCGKCPSGNVICLLSTSGFPGQCSCVMDQSLSLDLCGDSVGAVTVVDTNKMCGYSHFGNDARAVWAFQMEDLVMIPCLQASRAICSSVYTSSQGNIRLSVAIATRFSTSSKRRLLSEEDEAITGPETYTYQSEYENLDDIALHRIILRPGWNVTAAPCSILALEYQKNSELGIMDLFTLRKCAYWRHVGSRLIKSHNLTGLRDTFLVSVDDFAYALTERDSLASLVRNPGVFMRALLYHPWLKPLRGLGVAAANVMEQMQWTHDMNKFDWAQDIEEDILDIVSGEENVFSPVPIQNPIKIRRPFVLNWSSPTLNQKPSPPTLNFTQSKAGRKLMSEVSMLSVEIFQGNRNPPVGLQTAQDWLRGPFTWPPDYDYSLEACPLGLAMYEIGRDVVIVLKLYYQNFDAPKAQLDRSLRAAIPNFNYDLEFVPVKNERGTSWYSTVFHWLLDTLHIDIRYLVRFFAGREKWTLQWIFESSLKCDLASVMSCDRHDRDLIASVLVFFLVYILISTFATAIGFPVLGTLFFWSGPFFILWLAFGFSPMCFPMLPTCLMEDIIEAAQRLLPPEILFPADLTCDGNNQTCLVSCSSLNFTSWLDPLAFAVCSSDIQICKGLSNFTTGSDYADALIGPLQTKLTEKSKILESTNDPSAYSVCTWVTWVMTIPILFLFIGVFMFANVVIMGILGMLPGILGIIAQSFAFHRD